MALNKVSPNVLLLMRNKKRSTKKKKAKRNMVFQVPFEGG